MTYINVLELEQEEKRKKAIIELSSHLNWDEFMRNFSEDQKNDMVNIRRFEVVYINNKKQIK